METDGEARLNEIRAWFNEHGYELFVHEIEGQGWRAPFMPKGVRLGNSDYGVGPSAVQAAEDAKSRHLRGSRIVYAQDEAGKVVEHAVVVKVDDESPPQTIYPDALVHEREIYPPTVSTETIETLTRYGWHVACEDEPDGKVTCAAYDEDSGAFLRSALGDDFHDAVLNLIAEMTPPSVEVRRERDARRSHDTPD